MTRLSDSAILSVFVVLSLLAASGCQNRMLVAEPPAPSEVSRPYPDGKVERINGYLVLHVSGTPQQMGEQHGRLLKAEVQRMIRDLIKDGVAYSESSYRELIKGARVMETFLPVGYREELKALAEAAEVSYDDIVLAQLFGDVRRAQWSSTTDVEDDLAHPDELNGDVQCSSYAIYGPATKTGECIVGRNMDYWDHGVSSYGAVLIHFTPKDGYPFFTVSWAGIINGWTAMNAHGIVVANNTSYDGKSDSLEGVSTCFMLRKIAQFAKTVEEGVQMIRETPRACGTNMIVAGGQPPAAAIVEYDHDEVAVRWAKKGVVLATNYFRKLYCNEPLEDDDGYGRYGSLWSLIQKNYGKADHSMNFADSPDVYLSINLHSIVLFPKDLSFRVAMGRFLFSVGLNFQNDLEDGALSERLKKRFEDHGASLSGYAAITTVEKGCRWGIGDEYAIIKEGETLNVYTGKQPAAEGPFRAFKMTRKGIVEDEGVEGK